jgi:hypothetical protein
MDVVKSLKAMEVVDLDKEKPVRRISKLSDATDKQIEQDGFNIDYQEEKREHLA